MRYIKGYCFTDAMTFQHALAILVWITTFDTAQSEPIWRTILPNGPSQTIKTPVNPKEQAIQIIFPPPLTAGTKTAHVEFDFYTSLNVLLHNTHRPNISVIINLETGNNKLGGRFHFSHDDMTCSKSFGSMIPTEDRITFTLTSLKFYMESGITIDLGEEANCEIKEEPIKFQSTDLFYFRVRSVKIHNFETVRPTVCRAASKYASRLFIVFLKSANNIYPCKS